MELADQARTALIEQIALGMRETARWTGRAALSPRVAAALAKVRREAFVAPGSERAAYENRPLPIGHGQTISQPFVVALMTELLDLQPTISFWRSAPARAIRRRCLQSSPAKSARSR